MGAEKESLRAGSGRRKRRWLIFLILVLVLAGVQVLRLYYQDEEKRLRTLIREKIENYFEDETNDLKNAYGLKPFSPKSDPGQSDGPNQGNVVLIHGLDDPGLVWMNLAPRLEEAGFKVWIMTYPNDQPIVDSADLFRRALERICKQGIKKIDVVAHSMGGLVTREMLTNPEWQYTARSESGIVPKVNHFIMVGTPNHGSRLAQFRIFAEMRDQWTQFFKEDYTWLKSIVDGTGEAGIDLAPESRFLETLNQRPHPANVAMLVIIGRIAPWNSLDREKFVDAAGKTRAGSGDQFLDDLKLGLESLIDGLGDGLVTVDSARLEKVPFKIVNGNHLTIIRNLSPASENEPPAIPIILETLRE